MSLILALDPDGAQHDALDRVRRDLRGHELVSVRTCADALKAMHSRPPQLLLLPLLLPQADEEQLLAHARVCTDQPVRVLTVPLFQADNPSGTPAAFADLVREYLEQAPAPAPAAAAPTSADPRRARALAAASAAAKFIRARRAAQTDTPAGRSVLPPQEPATPAPAPVVAPPVRMKRQPDPPVAPPVSLSAAAPVARRIAEPPPLPIEAAAPRPPALPIEPPAAQPSALSVETPAARRPALHVESPAAQPAALHVEPSAAAPPSAPPAALLAIKAALLAMMQFLRSASAWIARGKRGIGRLAAACLAALGRVREAGPWICRLYEATAERADRCLDALRWAGASARRLVPQRRGSVALAAAAIVVLVVAVSATGRVTWLKTQGSKAETAVMGKLLPPATPAASAPTRATGPARQAEPAGARPGRTGHLKVASTPDGARVLIDGAPRGQTPLLLDNVAVGAHTVTIESSAGTVKRSVTIRADEAADVSETIIPGSLTVYSPFDLTITDGPRTIRLDERYQTLLPPGPHDITLENRRLGYRDVRHLDLEPGKTVVMNVVPPRSTLSVKAASPVDVSVDGVRVGSAPLDVPVELGTREVVVRDGAGAERRFTVTITVSPVTLNVD